MLRMSKLADYGTVMLVAMARAADVVQSAGALGDATGIPVPTVSKVMKMLVRGGLTVSLRGASGGYLLRRPAQQVTLADIVSAIDGPLGITECSAVPGLCQQELTCGARANWQKVNRVVFEALRQVSLADLAGPVLSEIDITAIRARGTAAQTVSRRAPASKNGGHA